MNRGMSEAYLTSRPTCSEYENGINGIIHLQSIANRLLDVFNDASKVTKSHISAVNIPVRNRGS